jgi:hypothetical protein
VLRRLVLCAVVLVLSAWTLGAASALEKEPVQHGAQPNPGEVRPPSPQGDAPSPSAGTLTSDRATDHRLFGLPAGLALGLVVLVVVVAGLWVYARRPVSRRAETRPPARWASGPTDSGGNARS